MSFTFTITILAIVNSIRYRKYNQPIFSASKFISLASALVSMLSLETAMLNAFGTQNDEGFRRIITAITGSVVCVVILTIGIFMVVYGNKKLKNKK